ncbi:MAG: hypothetical protein WCH98_00130 [Verrucomicrobiota bacterium]
MNCPKIIFTNISAAFLCASLGLAADGGSKAIDLKKPVGESLKPDGFYWTFDEGILGEGQPSQVDDLSGNGFNGRIIKTAGKPQITYAEGKFGTGIYAQGLGAMVEWTEKSLVNAASDPAKLTMKDQPFTGGVWFKMDDRRPGMHALIRQTEAGVGWRLCVVKEISKRAAADRDEDLSTQSPGDTWQLDFEIGDSRVKGKSFAATPAFADGKWHHVGFSVSSEKAAGKPPTSKDFTVTYWLDGEVFDTATFQANAPDPEPGTLSLRAGFRVWGVMDDAFVTSGIHTFKK